ncbi:Receptor-like serine/threonine-protein kinase ALE2 [Platanthera guangdongensis]|uniref:Receptor-like serine/threonine-protein kinase ALE2 n=1 Tax=Platanthera guangdongensis TaxID=2320717 RepID=A0ABR2M9H3_9ASPA
MRPDRFRHFEPSDLCAYFSSVVFIYEDSGLVGINGLESCPSITLVDSNPLSRCDPKSPWCESKAALTSSSPSTALFQPTTPPANPNRALPCSDFRLLFPGIFIVYFPFMGKRIVVHVKPRSVDSASVESSLPRPTSTRFFAYDELKEATNNFEPACVLGEGGFGRVFKGILGDGTAVAIKKLSSGGHQGDNEFLVEVEMLSRLHHRNLVKLLGYFNGHSPSRNLLCYELVPNGSLEAWLHGSLPCFCKMVHQIAFAMFLLIYSTFVHFVFRSLGIEPSLDWDTRMKIALDSARGLSYLHEDSQPSVIHRDFKASNILLENNFHAKVSDFGLAKQAPEDCASHLSTRVMGTFGYVAPEYAMTGHLLVKSDVYSYGVVLLELLTGRRPVDMSQPSGHENLVTWARPILRDKNRLEELADPKLEGKYMMKDFLRVCTIAAACVAPEASQRPTMGEVVLSLKMVQGLAVYQDTMPTLSARPNIMQSTAAYGSDGTSSLFSSEPFSNFSVFDNENISRIVVFSEDLHEGR